MKKNFLILTILLFFIFNANAQGTENTLAGFFQAVAILFLFLIINFSVFVSFLIRRKKWQRVIILIGAVLLIFYCRTIAFILKGLTDHHMTEVAGTVIVLTLAASQILVAAFAKVGKVNSSKLDEVSYEQLGNGSASE